MHKACAVIPVYNHEHALPRVVAALHASGLPCVLVDDASSPACAAVMDQLATQANTYLVRLPVNQGKGGAVMTGLRRAHALGFSHALQVDADGQHDQHDDQHQQARIVDQPAKRHRQLLRQLRDGDQPGRDHGRTDKEHHHRRRPTGRDQRVEQHLPGHLAVNQHRDDDGIDGGDDGGLGAPAPEIALH